MELKVIYKNARCAVLEIGDGGAYETLEPYDIFLNGEFFLETERTITSLYDLEPETFYKVEIRRAAFGDRADAQEDTAFCAEAGFTTDREFVTLNVRDFGAKGDGIQDDTLFIQSAVMACPKDSRVLVPAGTYRIVSLFLKDNVKIELEKGAVLSADTDRSRFPVLKGMIKSFDGKDEYNLGTWEGDPLPMFSAVVTGINIENAVIYGRGVIEGNAGFGEENWWYDPKKMKTAFRPRMIFLERCKHVVIQGLTLRNSPSWNIHPYFSEHLKFLDLRVLSPKDSPNTDGLDPESCRDVEITGICFSVGDDCIAVKSGKIYMGTTYKRPSEDIVVSRCCMRDGHGSVTIGSEMAGGVKNLTVRDCVFRHTDRGLRIKTRRGRGKNAVVDGILFERIHMDQVKTPFVINSFYYCDPDGNSEYVRTKERLPVDDRTPWIKHLTFRDIEAVNCHVAAAYLYGLPERKIGKVEMERVSISFAPEAQKGQPAMMEGCSEQTCRQGIYANNIEELVLRNVKIEGQLGPEIETEHIGHIDKR